MSESMPQLVLQSLEQGASRLGRGLNAVGWSYGEQDAPCHEINAALNIHYFLSKSSTGFDSHLLGTMVRRGRVDLMGLSRQSAIVIQTRGFGQASLNSSSILAGSRGLADFEPEPDEIEGLEGGISRWGEAENRWACVAISSFRGPRARDAWIAPDEAAALKAYRAVPSGNRRRERLGEWVELRALLNEFAGWQRGAFPIHDDLQPREREGWLLWAARRLEVEH